MRMLWIVLFLALCNCVISNKTPIVYVYTVVPAVCKYGLPDYIRFALEQAVISQPDCDIIMASNYGDCPTISQKLENITSVIKLDVTKIESDKTRLFANVSRSMFEADYGSELWITSALRFFILEDIMISKGYSEMIHVEADNLLYGRFTSLLPVLRSSYRGLAATPLNSNKSFITASVLWISSLSSLQAFNAFLLSLGRNTNKEWQGYLTWLRPYGCCKAGGIDPDASGQGIRPYAINEMSMLAYYHFLAPLEFHLFPVVPFYRYFLNRHVCNISSFGPDGSETGPATGIGIWDPNSWGQFLGGTATRKGRDRGFTDSSHIAGQAMRTTHCRPKMLCVPLSKSYLKWNTSEIWSNRDQPSCVLAPHVKCEVSAEELAYPISSVSSVSSVSSSSSISKSFDHNQWTPLWNLHVHSKHTQDYVSRPCQCPEETNTSNN